MHQTPATNSAEGLLKLFAVWGLGLAGIPDDLDESDGDPEAEPAPADNAEDTH